MSDGEIHAWHFATGKPIQLQFRGGIISSIETVSEPPPSGQWVAPGLFDLQVNGYAGVDFQQDNPTTDSLLVAARGLRQAGCTRFLLTLVTDDWARLMKRLRDFRSIRNSSPELTAAIAGWHIEGPFLSAEPGFHGAHDPQWMLDPTPAHIKELRAVAGNEPILLTLAPERRGAIDAIKTAVSAGITISLGHTDASAEVLRQARETGARGFTHLGNGIPRALDRHDNVIWRALETPGLLVSLIPDRIHVSPSLFRIVHRLLGSKSIYYTTDAMSAAGAPPGRYRLGKLELDVGADQVVRQPGKPLFAGSALRPIDGIFRAAEMLGCKWQDVWPRFSEMPANLLGLKNELSVGQPANFCLLKDNNQNELVDLQVCAQGNFA
jgi:N-acetylglucosamine-6-phosphate deacetylase